MVDNKFLEKFMTHDGKELTVKDVMRTAVTVEVEKTLHEVLEKMIREKVNSLLVVDDSGKFIGIVDPAVLIKTVVPAYLKGEKLAAHFASESMLREEVEKAAQKPLSEFINADVVTVGVEENLMKAAVVAITRGNMRIPVLDEDDKPVGLLTRTEIKQVIGSYLGIEECFKDTK